MCQTVPYRRLRVLRDVRLPPSFVQPAACSVISRFGIRERGALMHLRASSSLLYPRGPRSGPGYSVPVHQHLLDPIHPTRRHSTTSPQSGLYALSSLCPTSMTPRRPTRGSVLSLAHFLDMSSSETPGSSSVACIQFLHRRRWP